MHRLDPQSLPAHVDTLYRVARALCDSAHDAEDLVQETFVRVLAKPRLVREDDRVYLMRALRNTYFNQRRTAGRRPVAAAPLEGHEPAESRTASQPEQAAMMQDLYEAIGKLPEDFRFALVAVDLVGLSYAEAGRAAGAREATIATRVYRARQRLAAELREADGKDQAPQSVISDEHA